MKLAYRIAKISLLSLFIVFMLLICCCIYLVKTEYGSHFLVTHIPHLTVENSKGSLSGGWSAKKLVWQSPSIHITVDHPTFNWYASCLFKATICIDQLSIKQLAVDLPDSSSLTNNNSPAKKETLLPTLHLPINIAIKQLTLNKFSLNDETIIENVKFNQINWQKTTVSFAKFIANYENLANAELTGAISLVDNWPLQLTGQFNLEQLSQQPWIVSLKATGDLQQQLSLTLKSQGYLKGSLSAKAQVLKEKIPAQLSLHIQDFYPNGLTNIPKTLTIKQLQLTAKGTLQEGYLLHTNALLAGHTQPIKVTLDGLMTKQGIDFYPIKLNSSDQRFISLEGQVNWLANLTAHAKINWQAFPWQELYPVSSTPPVTLESLQADLNYQSAKYQAKLTGVLKGPAGSFELTSSLQGNWQQLSLSQLVINTPDKGLLKGSLEVTFNPTINWLTHIELHAINPNYWLPQLTGHLQGKIYSQGSLINNQLIMQNNIAIDGTLRRHKALIKAQLITNNEQWHIPELLIQLGNNQLEGQALVSKQLQAKLNINLVALQQLLPDLRGNLKGQITLAGSMKSPQAHFNLKGQGIGFQQQHIADLQINASLNQQRQTRIALTAHQIKSYDILWGNLTIKSTGDLTKQQVQLQLTDGIVQLLTTITSKQDYQKKWSIVFNKFNISSQGQQWQLQKATQLAYTPSGNLTLQNHCFQNGQATLCAIGQQQLLPQIHINYQLTQFPLISLTPWLPHGFKWQGIGSGTVDLKMLPEGPHGKIAINANNGSFTLKPNADHKWQNYTYQELSLISELTPNKAKVAIKFNGNSLGKIKMTAQLDPSIKNKPLKGNFTITGLDLNIFQPFIPQLEQLTGKINGFANISGTLTKPYITGKIKLTDGNMSGDIPISLEKVQLAATIEGESLKVNGDWHSGSKGYGTVAGIVAWSKELDVNLAMQTDKLPIIVAPYAELQAATNLKLRVQKNIASLTGIVQIPKGKITVREIPPTTIKVSSDAKVINKQATDKPPSPLQLQTNIDVIIGEEHLQFAGFGLTSTLVGRLKVTNNLLTQGEINLKDGQFRAYGQNLDIRRARIIFVGSLTEPTLDIEAVRVVDEVTAGLRITGLASQPKVTIFSTPAMSQDQALAYIILGRPMGAGDTNMLARAALVLGVTGGSPIIGNIANKVGIEDFQLDTTGSGDKTSVVASGNITDKLSIHYGFNIFQAVNNIMLRYKLSKTIYLEAATGAASSLDLFYKKSF